MFRNSLSFHRLHPGFVESLCLIMFVCVCVFWMNFGWIPWPMDEPKKSQRLVVEQLEALFFNTNSFAFAHGFLAFAYLISTVVFPEGFHFLGNTLDGHSCEILLYFINSKYV